MIEKSIDNFYTQDGYDGRMRNIYHLSPNLSWVGGCPYYGFKDGVAMTWGVNQEPTYLAKVTDEREAREFARLIELKNYREKIMHHLDEIVRLRNLMNSPPY